MPHCGLPGEVVWKMRILKIQRKTGVSEKMYSRWPWKLYQRSLLTRETSYKEQHPSEPLRVHWNGQARQDVVTEIFKWRVYEIMTRRWKIRKNLKWWNTGIPSFTTSSSFLELSGSVGTLSTPKYLEPTTQIFNGTGQMRKTAFVKKKGKLTSPPT